jgi:hypothetical protein
MKEFYPVMIMRQSAWIARKKKNNGLIIRKYQQK